MDLPKQLPCLSSTSRFFGEYISTGKYQHGEEFTCQWFTAHSFDLNMLGTQKQEILLIWLLDLLWFLNDGDASACKESLCDVNIFGTLLQT